MSIWATQSGAVVGKLRKAQRVVEKRRGEMLDRFDQGGDRRSAEFQTLRGEFEVVEKRRGDLLGTPGQGHRSDLASAHHDMQVPRTTRDNYKLLARSWPLIEAHFRCEPRGRGAA